MNFTIDEASMLARFMRYVQIETTSDEEAEGTPSSACQWDLARVLEQDLKDLGLEDVRLSDHCYVYAKLPANIPSDHPRFNQVPAVGFISHMDVSPAVSGKNVRPQLHRNYDGGKITFPANPEIALTPETDAPLGDCRGLDIVTADGTTLLGADDKAGIAIIFALLETLKANPQILHGPLCIAFTPDEEIGRGVDCFELESFGAEVAYTVDGESLGEVEDETFSADAATVKIQGINVHPGYAKGKLVNALKIACDFVNRLPKDRLSPETTEGTEGFVHPVGISGCEESCQVKFIIRDFAEEGLVQKADFLKQLAEQTAKSWPGCKIEVEIREQYRNMKQMLRLRPEVSDLAFEAVTKAGLTPIHNPIRGGTDGSRLSFMGLPTPNLFTGAHNFHGLREWVAVQHMTKSAECCVELVSLWAQKGQKRGLLPSV